MVSRAHQAFYFSHTCSLNVSGKFFDTMGVPGGGTSPRQVHQIYQTFLYPHFFQMAVVWVMVCLGVRSSKTTLFHYQKLEFGLGVRVYLKFKIFVWVHSKFRESGGFGTSREAIAAGPRATVTASCIRCFTPTFCKI